MGLGWLEPSSESLLNEAELLDLFAGVKPVAAVAAFGRHEAVAVLPVADRRGWNVEHALNGANAVNRKVTLPHEFKLPHRDLDSRPACLIDIDSIPHHIPHHSGVLHHRWVR